MRTVPAVGIAALDASPASGVWNTYPWTSTPLQSPVSLNPAIFTTSLTNEGMPAVGAIPSPFECPVASPYLSANGSGMPDGHFDLRKMHQSGSGSVVGTATGNGQGQCHT